MSDVVAGRFALCDPIARGGAGVVWRAVDRVTGKLCAVKVLRRRDAGDLLWLVREHSVRLAHRHVLAPYAWAAEDANVVLASDLVEGGTLDALLHKHGPFAEPTVVTVLDQLLQALEHIHAAGLVHRDVTPANILLRSTGTDPIHVVLADFGLATESSEGRPPPRAGRDEDVVGTPGYLPPEVVNDGAPPHPRQDLYAAGQVAAALIIGYQPSELSTDRVPLDPVEPMLPPGRLADTIAALTAVEPERRLDSARYARALLSAGRHRQGPRTRDGAVIDIGSTLDHLAETSPTDHIPTTALKQKLAPPKPDPILTMIREATHAGGAKTQLVVRRAARPPAARLAVAPPPVALPPWAAPTPAPTQAPPPPTLPTPRPAPAVTAAPPATDTAATDAPAADVPASVLTPEPANDPAAEQPTKQPTKPTIKPLITRQAKATAALLIQLAQPRQRRPRSAADVEKAHDDALSRRATVTGIAVALAAVVITIPAVLIAGAGSDSPLPSRPSAPVPTSPPVVGAGGEVIQLGGPCTWIEQGNHALTGAGEPVVCTGSRGTYSWTLG